MHTLKRRTMCVEALLSSWNLEQWKSKLFLEKILHSCCFGSDCRSNVLVDRMQQPFLCQKGKKLFMLNIMIASHHFHVRFCDCAQFRFYHYHKAGSSYLSLSYRKGVKSKSWSGCCKSFNRTSISNQPNWGVRMNSTQVYKCHHYTRMSRILVEGY